jgi:hypothetical protein
VQAAVGAAAVEAAEQPNDIAVVFMLLLRCYLTFEKREKAVAVTVVAVN